MGTSDAVTRLTNFIEDMDTRPQRVADLSALEATRVIVAYRQANAGLYPAHDALADDEDEQGWDTDRDGRFADYADDTPVQTVPFVLPEVDTSPPDDPERGW